MRSLFYLCTVHASRGSAGTPTSLEPGHPSPAIPDAPSLQAIFIEAQRMLQTPEADPAVRRAAAFLLAAVGRSNDHARVEAVASLERAVTAADALAAAAASSSSGRGNNSGLAVPSSSNWELQHTVFGAVRLCGDTGTSTAATTDLGRACFQGVGSPDPAGARHCLALVAELALRDPSLVMTELSAPVSVAIDLYEAMGPAPPRTPGEGINLEDAFSRVHLARACAAVLHSDQGSSDVSRGGGPFWHMLCLLAIRDTSDVVRFGALEAMTGAVVTPSSASLTRSRASSSSATAKQAVREVTTALQRRARAWRLLVSQANTLVTIPGVDSTPSTATTTAATTTAEAGSGLKLIEVIARLLLLALRKVESSARFCVAATVAASLAESCLASQSTGTTRHITSPDVDRVIAILARELGSLIESPLRPAQRSSCVEALLYLQACGYPTSLTAAKLASVGGRGGGGGGGDGDDGVQDALLGAVLKCARARPKDAANFLSYASGVVGISPCGINLKKVTELWDAAAAGGKDGKTAALAAALEALGNPPPPSTRPRAGAGREGVVRAAREEAGWNSFVSTAAWWLGEHANELCEEYAGRKVSPPLFTTSTGGDGDEYEDIATETETEDEEEDGEEEEEEEDGMGTNVKGARQSGRSRRRRGRRHAHKSSSLAQDEAVIFRQATRNPALSRVIACLHDIALTATWQLRSASARALGKIAVRCGEPFRLQCYGILTACAVSGGAQHDALGLQGVVSPALSLLDRLYATQATLERLWEEHGEDVEGWPPAIISSLARRAALLRVQAERTVCAVPPERYAILGPKAVAVLAFAQEQGPVYASFLQTEAAKAGEKASSAAKRRDSTGPSLTQAKNKEVEDILSFGGSETSSMTFKVFANDDKGGGGGGGGGDRDAQIDSLMMASSREPQDMWAFNAGGGGGGGAGAGGGTGHHRGAPSISDEPSFNAFVTNGSGGTGDHYGTNASPPPAPLSPSGTPTTTAAPQEWEPFADFATATTTNTSAVPSPRQQQQKDAAGTARVVGSGIMAHTFIADASNPEELSIFEGDRVDVLEESDGWMLVRDPSGSQGLVPTAYIRLEHITSGGGGVAGGGGQDVWAKFASGGGSTGAGSPAPSTSSPHHYQQQQRHARALSTDFHNGTASNEDFLDRFFAGGGAPSPRSAGGGGGGGNIAADFPGEGELSRQGTWNSQQGGSAAVSAAVSAAAAAVTQSGSGGVGNPFTTTTAAAHHRRAPSQASSHQRTLSAGSDPWGSMPGTPGQIEGPERAIVTGFVGEMEGEMTVEVGDRVKVHSEVGGWARVMRVSDAKSGLVPSWAVGDSIGF